MSESKAGLLGGDSSSKPNVAAQNEQHVTAAAATVASQDPDADPDEDDLDDLDDMLDDFSTVRIDSDSKKPAAAGPGRPSATATTEGGDDGGSTNPATFVPALDTDTPASSGLDDFSEDEFQKQLQAGMAELMQDLDKSPEMQSQFETIFKELGAAAALGSEPLTPSTTDRAASSPSNAGASSSKGAEQAAADLSADASFQETIRRTMERMQASGDQATAAAAAEGSEDDFIAEMMKVLKDMPGADGTEEEMSKMLMGMMEQLTNKEILYEPMKELDQKFPEWMKHNKEKLSADDLKRYQEQEKLVKEMVAKFEEPTYKDENVSDREYIVDRMQKMQAAGSPPLDLVGDMPSAKEIFDGPDDSCAQQ